ncbi:hypothetical protein [Devosia neptuniae]|uniref:hypothetical protein n=1 Tax=Devosia TaxID=46913 RepID=UPI0022AE5EDF|nr:hypothetical protein [Devosia neptuniae]MCZ4346114.1 hypothetical protein [Devosia neptuniae]
MFQIIRISILTAILIGLVVSVPSLNKPAMRAIQDVGDLFDARPERQILFVGNSRTYFNDMPAMVRSMADSANAPEKYRIQMHAPAGRALADHWANPQVHDLLAQQWHHVVIQAQSGEQYDRSLSAQMLGTARKLISEARLGGAAPAMFVTWRYTTDCPEAAGSDTTGYRQMHANIQAMHRQLNRETGVDLVNVGRVWEVILKYSAEIPLYLDCNHPSIYGSYLSALAFYDYFSGGDVLAVTYVPDGMPQDQAKLLREAVSRYSSAAAQ